MPARFAPPAPGPIRDYGFLPADLRAFVARTESFDAPPGHRPDIAESRARYDAMCAAFNPPHPPGLTTEDLAVAGVPCRRYRPAAAADGGPILVYYHGGGFVLGGLHSHDSICADLADRTGLVLVAVDYRLAPEHRHPAAYDDALAVACALPGPKVLAGDSAGGTLAAAVAASGAAAQVRGQILVYPGLGGRPDLPSMTHHAFAPLLAAADIAGYQDARCGPGRAEDDPTARPLAAASLSGLPPTAISVAECDPLASEAVLYAGRLAAAGVPVALTVEPFLVHGHLRARHSVAGAAAAFGRIAAAAAALAAGRGPRPAP